MLIVGVFVVVSWKKSATDDVVLSNPPAIPAYLIGGLRPEQQQEVDKFKQLIFARIALPKPLTEEEKAVLTSVFNTQRISYQFSEEEEKRIQESLQ